MQPVQPTQPPASDSALGLSTGAIVGLGVGIGIGGSVALFGAGLWGVREVRKRRKRVGSGKAEDESLPPYPGRGQHVHVKRLLGGHYGELDTAGVGSAHEMSGVGSPREMDGGLSPRELPG